MYVLDRQEVLQFLAMRYSGTAHVVDSDASVVRTICKSGRPKDENLRITVQRASFLSAHHSAQTRHDIIETHTGIDLVPRGTSQQRLDGFCKPST